MQCILRLPQKPEDTKNDLPKPLQSHHRKWLVDHFGGKQKVDAANSSCPSKPPSKWSLKANRSPSRRSSIVFLSMCVPPPPLPRKKNNNHKRKARAARARRPRWRRSGCRGSRSRSRPPKAAAHMWSRHNGGGGDRLWEETLRKGGSSDQRCSDVASSLVDLDRIRFGGDSGDGGGIREGRVAQPGQVTSVAGREHEGQPSRKTKEFGHLLKPPGKKITYFQ